MQVTRVGHTWSWPSDNKPESSCFRLLSAMILQARPIYGNPEQNLGKNHRRKVGRGCSAQAIKLVEQNRGGPVALHNDAFNAGAVLYGGSGSIRTSLFHLGSFE